MNLNLFSVKKRRSFVRMVSTFSIFCLICSSFVIINSGNVYAASKAKVSKVKFSSKTVDATMGLAKTKVTINLKSKVKGAKCAVITLKSGKKKVKVSTRTIKNKKITATLLCDNYTSTGVLGPGKWKVTNIEIKKGKTTKKWQPGKWSGGKYYSGFYYNSFKQGKTLAKGKCTKKQTLTVIAGDATNIKITEPTSAEVGTKPNFVAQVKKSNGAPVNGGTVVFTFKSGSGTIGTTNALVNGSGIAQTQFEVPKVYDDKYFSVEAKYSGVKQKFRPSSTRLSVTQIAQTVLVQGKFYKMDSNSKYYIEAKLTNSRTGQPISGVGIDLDVETPSNELVYWGSEYEVTGTSGIVRVELKTFSPVPTLDSGHYAVITVNDSSPNYKFVKNPIKINYNTHSWDNGF